MPERYKKISEDEKEGQFSIEKDTTKRRKRKTD